jgi:membrane protease YdiL (CAAX protease family)
MRSKQPSATGAEIPHPIGGLASLAVAAFAAAAVLLGIPRLFGVLLQSATFAAMPAPALETAFTLVTFGLLALIAFAAIRFTGLAVPFGAKPGAAAATGLAMGVIGLTVSAALCAIAGTAQEGMPATEGVGLIVLETVLLAIQSGAEEYYFRAWLQKDLERRWGQWPALGAAALLFAALHFVAAASDPLTFVTMLLGGLLFGLAYIQSGSFLLPWMIHFGWNWAEELVFGLTPNPGTGTFGALLNLDMRGSGWWGGGAEGLNASLSSVIVLVALLGATAAWPTQVSAKRPALRKAPAPG